MYIYCRYLGVTKKIFPFSSIFSYSLLFSFYFFFPSTFSLSFHLFSTLTFILIVVFCFNDSTIHFTKTQVYFAFEFLPLDIHARGSLGKKTHQNYPNQHLPIRKKNTNNILKHFLYTNNNLKL